MMTSPRRTRVVSMPTKPPESPLEIAYNSAVQSFVRRDHAGTHTSLGRLLKLTADLPTSSAKWYDAAAPKEDGSGDGQMWRFRVLKLLISAYASLYSDPPQRVDDLPPNLVQYLPPASPDLVLEHALEICQTTLHAPSNNLSTLPPQLLSTLLLAALKLQPAAPALAFARRTAESWLAELPNTWLDSFRVSSRNGSANARNDNQKDRNRESYLKVIELYVGEVLAREGEFEMARAFLDGDEMLGSKRKEALYRQLRSIEAHSHATSNHGIPPAPSPSASLVLPTPSSGRSRRSSSSSSSSSERTARPKSATAGISPTHLTSRPHPASSKGKGKERDVDAEADGDELSALSSSTVPMPKEIYVNPSSNSSSLRRTKTTTDDMRQRLRTMLDLIPSSARSRLTSPTWLLSYVLPVPLLLLLLVGSLRRFRRRGTQAVGAGAAVVGGDLRRRLEDLARRDGGRGLRAWAVYWLRWWLAKFAGVWKMGTTLTYL